MSVPSGHPALAATRELSPDYRDRIAVVYAAVEIRSVRLRSAANRTALLGRDKHESRRRYTTDISFALFSRKKRPKE